MLTSTLWFATAKSFNHHLWYITEELAPLASKTNESELNNTKWQLKKTWFFGKPGFIKCLLSATVSDDLSAFKWNDSWRFLCIIGVYDRFLNTSVTQWYASDAYQLWKLIVDITHVANNHAESEIKPCQDFIGSAHKEMHFQCTLQAVEKSCHTLQKK